MIQRIIHLLAYLYTEEWVLGFEKEDLNSTERVLTSKTKHNPQFNSKKRNTIFKVWKFTSVGVRDEKGLMCVSLLVLALALGLKDGRWSKIRRHLSTASDGSISQSLSPAPFLCSTCNFYTARANEPVKLIPCVSRFEPKPSGQIICASLKS